jgi:nucleolar protein 56
MSNRRVPKNVTRPIWSDAGTDPAAIAELLEAQSTAETLPEITKGPGKDRGALHQAAIMVARARIAESHTEKDRIIAQEVRAVDDLIRAANLMLERLREWYALHAPEVTRSVASGENLASLVGTHGTRKAVMEELGRAEEVKTSLGSDLEPEDLAVLQGFAGVLSSIYASWNAIEARISVAMELVAPNVSHVVGPVIGARMISQAGSLQKLAIVPTGTIQTLGAETALFRHLKEGTAPPKHGILYQHPKVNTAQRWKQGAIARAIALQTALAAKADAFTQNDLRAHLDKCLNEDLLRIETDRPKPRFGGAQSHHRSGGRPGGDRGQSRGPPRRDGPRRDDNPGRGNFGSGEARRQGPPSGGSSYGSRDRPRDGPGQSRPYGKPAAKPYGKPAGKSYDKPASKPYQKKRDRPQQDGPVRPPRRD